MPDQKSLAGLLAESSIVLDATVVDIDDAIRQAGAALESAGAVDPTYTEAMLERERSVSTYVGEGVAVPHGTLAAQQTVVRDALVLLRIPAGLDWGGETVHVVVGLAARGRGHIGLLSRLAAVVLDPARSAALRDATTTADVYAALAA